MPGAANRLTAACLSFLLLVFTAHAGASGTATPFKVTVLHMNDPHAHYLPYRDKGFDGPIGGFAKAQTIVSEIRAANAAEGRETLLCMAGDLLMGTPFSTAFKGELGVKLMNLMKFDMMTVGNHEFDYGKENLLDRLKPIMQFPLLAANLKFASGEPVVDHFMVREIPDRPGRLVIFGLVTADTPVLTHRKNVEGLVFEDPIKCATEILEPFSERDLVIAVTHLGVEGDRRLAEACPKIDVIIGGHSHTALTEPLKVGNTLICQAGAYARYVGRLDLDVINGEVVGRRGQLVALTPEIKEDPAVTALIDEYKAKMDPTFGKVIGRTEVFLEGTRSAVRSGDETDLGKLIAYAMKSYSGADAAVYNGGAIRAGFYPGDITVGDLETALPFPDTLVTVELTGADLEAVLRRSRDLPPGSGGKLQTIGMTYRNEDGKIRILRVKGKDFNPSEKYSVATNNFLADGGDGYTIFGEQGTAMKRPDVRIREIVITYIKDKGPITQALLDGIR